MHRIPLYRVIEFNSAWFIEPIFVYGLKPNDENKILFIKNVTRIILYLIQHRLNDFRSKWNVLIKKHETQLEHSDTHYIDSILYDCILSKTWDVNLIALLD